MSDGSLTRDEIKSRLGKCRHNLCFNLVYSDAAIDWFVDHPGELTKIEDMSSEYKGFYLPDELADIIGKSDRKISKSKSSSDSNSSSSGDKSNPDPDSKAKSRSKSNKKPKIKTPKLKNVKEILNDPLLMGGDEDADETSKVKNLRERLQWYVDSIQEFVRSVQNPFASEYSRNIDFNKIGSNLGGYRKTRSELQNALGGMNRGRGVNAPRFGVYWTHRDDFQNGTLNAHDFWNLPTEQAEAINQEAEEYYQSIKGDKELDPDLLGDNFIYSESFYRPIDSVGSYDVENAFTNIFNGTPQTLGGLAHFAQEQGYLGSLDDPFFTKLVAQQFGTDDNVAQDYIGQLSALEYGDRQFLAGPRGYEDEENFFKKLKITHDPKYSKNSRRNPNRLSSIPDFDPKSSIFRKIFGKNGVDEFQKRAANALFSLMIDAPGASKDYILRRARESEPGVDANVFKKVYSKIHRYLNEKGVISADAFRGGAGRNIVDANLYAQEMQGWSDDEKVAEYDRLVAEGLASGSATDDLSKIAEIDRYADTTFKETEEAISQGNADFSFSNEAYSYVDPSKVGGNGGDFIPPVSGDGDSSIPQWKQLANAYFKRRPTKSTRLRKATEALFQEMVQNPGASYDYILERARKREPNISKGVFNAPYHDVRDALSLAGIITPDMDDREGQRVVDANLRAQEMQGWSDDEMIAEYDRLVKEGKIDRLSDYELEKQLPKGTYRAEKKRLKNEKKSLDSEIKLYDRLLSDKGSDKDFDKLLSQNPGLADEILNLPKDKSDEPIKRLKQEAEEKLKEIVSELEEVRKGYREWAEGSLKPKLFTDRINETLQETGKAIDKNGAGNANGTFSPEVEEVVKASGSTESFFSKRRRETDDDKKKRNREKIVDDAVLDVLPDDAKDSYRQFTTTRQKKDTTRTARWTYKGAQTGEVFGRVLGFGSSKVASGFASFGAKIGSAAAGVAAFLGPIMVAAGVVAGLVAVFKKLKKAAEGAANKMMEYGQYDSNLFAANVRHQGREFQRNVQFAQGTSETGSELIEAMDDFKDEAQPIMIEFQNWLNKIGKKFFDTFGRFAKWLKDVGEIFDNTKKMWNNIPGHKEIEKIVKAAFQAFQIVFNPWKQFGLISKGIGAFTSWFKGKQNENLAPQRAAEADSFGATEAENESQKSEEEKAFDKEKAEKALNVQNGDYTAYHKADMSQEAQDYAEAHDVSGEVQKNKESLEELADIMGVDLKNVQHNENFVKKAARKQMAERNLEYGIEVSEDELIRRNAELANGYQLAAAGFGANGEALTREAQIRGIEIVKDQGKSVWENEARVNMRGELANQYFATGEIDDEAFKRYAELPGNERWEKAYEEDPESAKKSLMRNMNENRRLYESDALKYMMGQKADDRLAFDFKELDVSNALVKTGTSDELFAALKESGKNTEGLLQALKEISAETMGYAKETAENTKPEDEKDPFQDPVFRILSRFVEENRTVQAPQAFIDAQQTESQYGRFAGRPNQANWGLNWEKKQ